MKLNPPLTVAEIANIINGQVIGNPSQQVEGINEIHRVVPGDLTFCDVEKYYNKSFQSAATIILINKAVTPPDGKSLIVSDDPFRDYNFLTEYFQPRSKLNETAGNENIIDSSAKIHPKAVIGKGVVIGADTEIGANVVMGNNVVIGNNTIIFPNVTIYENCIIGSNCTLNANCVLGGEAFYYKKRPNGRDKMLSKGRVVLEDWVDIGANTTIDKGVSADTLIGEHTKIDNLVQIGHDTIIGKRCIIAAQTGIAGASLVEDDVIIWGQVGIPSDVKIGKGAIILAKSGVMSSLEGGKTYLGTIAKERKRKLREFTALSKLTDLLPEIEEYFNKNKEEH